MSLAAHTNGADAFIGQCLHSVRSALPRVKTETRIGSAFFNETIAERLHSTGVEFTIYVPFERFTELKGMIEGRKRWRQYEWRAQLLRNSMETQVLNRTLPLYLHPQT